VDEQGGGLLMLLDLHRCYRGHQELLGHGETPTKATSWASEALLEAVLEALRT
jgi:hypothetical protein